MWFLKAISKYSEIMSNTRKGAKNIKNINQEKELNETD